MVILQPVVRYYLVFLANRRVQIDWRHWKNIRRRFPRVASGIGLLLLEESDESTETTFLRRNDSDGTSPWSSSGTAKGDPSVSVWPLSSRCKRSLRRLLAGEAIEGWAVLSAMFCGYNVSSVAVVMIASDLGRGESTTRQLFWFPRASVTISLIIRMYFERLCWTDVPISVP